MSVEYDDDLLLDSDDEYRYSDIDDDDDDEVDNSSNIPSARAADSVLSPPGAAKKKRLASGSTVLAHSMNEETQNYRVIDEDELKQEMNALVEDIAQVVEVSVPVASILLRHFQWNKEKLFEGYYADPVQASQDAGVAFANISPQVPQSGRVMCNICCDEYAPEEAFAMGCGHFFCFECWKPYLALKVAEGPTCVTTRCPAHGCNEVVPDDIFQRLLDVDTFNRFMRFVLRSFADINRNIVWCPSPGCNHAVTNAGGLSQVQCQCGCIFCPRCGEETHAPSSCDQLSSWQEKCRNESETANWILANTKKCPKCNVRIEKNQGCNHMTCRKCAYEFCWICMADWHKHGSSTGGYYKCNRYDPTVEGNSDAARAKAELDRYLHYYQRFANHAEAGKFAQRMREGTEARMVELQSKNGDSSWIDVQFLNAATELLIRCRRVLKYTYVFGYYLPPGKEKNLFEYLQENLEKNTEHLTGLSEAPLDKMDRSEVINYTRVTEQFLQHLLEGVEEGLTAHGN